MSLQTLEMSVAVAKQLMEVPPETEAAVNAITTHQIHDIGAIAFRDGDNFVRIEPYLSLYQVGDTRCGGGNRLGFSPDPRRMVQELSAEMGFKNFIGGLLTPVGEPVGGGKIFGHGRNTRNLSHAGRIEYSYRLGYRLGEQGRLGYQLYSTAGDMGTGHPDYMDAIMYGYHDAVPLDPYYRAVVAAKSKEEGGLQCRTEMTGKGVADTALFEWDRKAEGETWDITSQGFGVVSAYALRFLEETAEQRGTKPYRLTAISEAGEKEGQTVTLYIANMKPGAPGIEITDEMVQAVGLPTLQEIQKSDDPTISAKTKLELLARMIEKNQPGLELKITDDPDAIFKKTTRAFMPAALPDTINERTVRFLPKGVRVFEAANGPTTPGADTYIVEELEGTTYPDIETNKRGSVTSAVEINANVDAVDRRLREAPDEEVIKAVIAERGHRDLVRLHEMANLLGTPSLRVAACAIGYGRMAMVAEGELDSRISGLLYEPAMAA